MDLREITDQLHSALKRRGLKSAIVSAAHVTELRRTIENGRAEGLIHDEVYRQYARSFDSMLSQDFPSARSIVAVALPQPLLEVMVTVDGKRQPVIIPQSYDHAVRKPVANAVENILKPHGYEVRHAALPRKLLAAHSGLARYGKNNIAYVDGMGSFLELLAFYTDLPCVSDAWQDPQMLELCDDCTACVKKCPTGAIDPDRFQLYAEKCLTFHNESSEPFPAWIDKSWHHCLIGCMKCQHYCPVNKDVRSWTERFAELTGEESEALLSGAPKTELPKGLLSIFENTALLDDPAALARNLKSVLAATG
jgi:epoxyqueuosine reductase